MPSLGCSTRVLVIIAILLIALVVVGSIGGILVSDLLGITSPSFMKFPELHVELKSESITEPFLSGFSLTNTILAAWVTIIVLVVIAYAATRKMKLVPGRLQGLVEAGLEMLLNFVEGIAGKQNGRRFFPVVATIFLFVIFNAYLALMPFFGPGIISAEHAEAHASTAGIVTSVEVEEGARVKEGDVIYLLDSGEEITAPIDGNVKHLLSEGDSIAADDSVASIKSQVPLFRNANTDINMTLALALMSFFFVEYWGLRALGASHYLGEFFNVKQLVEGIKQLFKGKIRPAIMGILLGVIDLFIGMIEMLSHFIRIVSFTFRLFGNMTAGEILILVICFLVPWVVVLPFYGLEFLIGFIQALIFAGLTLVFGVLAVSTHGDEPESG